MEMRNKSIPKVVIVDDVETNRFILRDIIADMGNCPVLAENGMQALKIAEHMKPQLIILDIAMPQMDGFEVCRRLKENPLTREVPIIFISAYDEPGDIVKGFEMGCEDYIVKPFIPEVVKARVGAHLKLYEANVRVHEVNRKLQLSVKEQRKMVDAERKRVLYALLRIARENACYDEQFMVRLQYNCRMLAEAMQLSHQFGALISNRFVDSIELAASLCDMDAEILRDIETLGDENGFIHMAREIAQYHHENWDGSGSPRGVKEDVIPLSAQIVSVVSEYCHLTQISADDRAFQEEAIQRMESDSGKKYNPEIMWILKRIVRQLQ